MLYILGCIFLVLFAVFGLVHFIGEIIFSATSVKREKNILVISGLEAENKDVELILRSAAERMKWLGKSFSSEIVCLDSSMSEETRLICENICKDYDFMEIKTLQELENML